jgi:hypothetical protein
MKKKRMSVCGTMVAYSTIIYKENEMYVTWSPEFDIACQGHAIGEATNDLDVSIRLYSTHPDSRMSKIDSVAVASRLMKIDMPKEHTLIDP